MSLFSFVSFYSIVALLCGLLFVGLYLKYRQRWSAMAAGLWLVYTIYEGLMQGRVLCSGECNIRIDLLLIFPVLFFVSMIALFLVLKNKYSQK